MIRRIRALVKKEFFQIIRDPSAFLISVALPILLLIIYGFGVSLDLNHLRIGLVMEDTSPDAQSLAKSFSNSPYFEVTYARDRREMTDLILAGAVRGIVVIPAYFSKFREQPSQVAPIQIITDGSEPNTAQFVQNYVQGAFNNWLQQEHISSKLQGLQLVRAESRFWYNEQLESRNFLLPGSIAIIMTLIGTLLTALVVAREWERGTMEALMATPVTIYELVISKLIPYFCLGMGAMTICVIVSVFFYGVPFRGSFIVLGLVSSAFLITATLQGLLISTVAKNQLVASQISILTAFLPAFILSGFLFEISSMPWVIQGITYLIPARYFVACLQTLFLVGNVWHLILPNTIYILIFGMILLTIIAKITVKRLD
jgi:ABC-2 type transport system permease protein